jgi:hypothetical protein
MGDELLEAEAVEEAVEGEAPDAPAAARATALPEPRGGSQLAPLLGEARAVALAAAGGLVAGAATVAAAKVVARGASGRRRIRVGRRSREVVASRSFLIDVHLLGR